MGTIHKKRITVKDSMYKMCGSNCKPHRERRDYWGLELLRMTSIGCAGREHIIEPAED